MLKANILIIRVSKQLVLDRSGLFKNPMMNVKCFSIFQPTLGFRFLLPHAKSRCV